MRADSSIMQKVGASAINCSLVVCLTAPVYPLLGTNGWKVTAIGAFFVYNMVFRARCIGMRVMGTYIEPPTSVPYALYYTAGFATCLYWVWVPFDLMMLNGAAQCLSVALTHNTLHGNLARRRTMDRDQYVARCKTNARNYLGKDVNATKEEMRAAVASIIRDLNKYPELTIAQEIVDIGIMYAANGDLQGVRDFIEGF